jgi:uncharacterized damage-inducible protein DinB
MNGCKVIETALASTQKILPMYLNDLADADLLVRPVAGANHIAWQLGHLIASEIHLMRSQFPNAAFPELPAGFAEQHGKETAAQESPKGFGGKEQYVALFNKVREATKAAAGKLSDADLDRATQGDMAPFAPTLAAFLMLVSNHTLMHVGQFTAVRRKLGKPIVF